MKKKKNENKIMFNDESYLINLYEKSKNSFENKKAKDYLNSLKYIENERITNKIIKNTNKIEGLKYTIIIELVIIIDLFIRIFPTHKILFLDYYFSNITLKVKGPNNNKIFCSNTQEFSPNYYPDLIYINDIQQNIINHSFYFNETENEVKFVWNNSIINCKYMFKDCPSILEVDLSEFDNSKVTEMYNMFERCQSLTSINFDNIKTSQLIFMGYMFNRCPSLNSINLSNFNTSKLQSLRYSFSGCSSLTSLNLSNFDTSKVSYMNNIFDGCTKLEFINMKNFIETKVTNGYNHSIFNNVPQNIVVCINETINQNIIIPQLKRKKCYNIDCSDNWKSKQKTIINSVNGCECELNDSLSCPNLNLTENKRICKSYNDGFYPKEGDSLIYDNYTECYKEPKGYYLDTNVYKKCFNTCETCINKGDNEMHYCLTCNDNFIFRINFSDYLNCYEKCINYSYYNENDLTYYCMLIYHVLMNTLN